MNEVFSREKLISIITALLQKYNAERAILFGSYARLEADHDSDIVLIVIGGAAFKATDIFSLAEDLHRSTGKEVDVYEIREIDQHSDFYRTIIREGVAIAA